MSNVKFRFGFQYDDGRRIQTPFDYDDIYTISPDAEPCVVRHKSWDLIAQGFTFGGEATAPAPVTIYNQDFGEGSGEILFAVILSDVDGYLSWGPATANHNSCIKLKAGYPQPITSGFSTVDATTAAQRSMAVEELIPLMYFYPDETQDVTAPVVLEAWFVGTDTAPV